MSMWGFWFIQFLSALLVLFCSLATLHLFSSLSIRLALRTYSSLRNVYKSSAMASNEKCHRPATMERRGNEAIGQAKESYGRWDEIIINLRYNNPPTSSSDPGILINVVFTIKLYIIKRELTLIRKITANRTARKISMHKSRITF